MAATASKACGSRRSRAAVYPARADRLPSLLLLAMISASLGATPARAVEWNLTPTLGAQATFTDNVDQSATDPQNAMILSVSPGFSLTSSGSRRVKVSANYSLTGVTRIGGDDNTHDINHNLGALGNAELIEDFLYLDATAGISQQLISLLGSPADANTNSANRATVGTYSLSPYVKKRLGTFAVAQARVMHSGAIFGDNVGADTNANALTASLGSGTRFNDLSWGLNYSLRKADYSGLNAGQDSSTFESTSANLGYALTRKFRLTGAIGRDSNDFLNASQINGSFYSVGFGWSPSRRTSLEANVGKRYGGNSYGFSFAHRTRFTNWNARYSESVSDISQQFLTDSGRVFLVCPDGSGGFSLSEDFSRTGCSGPYPSSFLTANRALLRIKDEDLVALGLANTSLAQGIFILKSLTGGVSWSKGRFGTGLSVFDTRRNYILAGNLEDRTHGINTNANYRLTPHTSLYTYLSLINNQVPAGLSGLLINRDDNIFTASIGLDHRFDPKTSGALTLLRQQRDSNDPASTYDENSITASILRRF